MRVVHCPQHVGTQIEANMEALASLHPGLAGTTEMDAGARTSVSTMRRVLGKDYTVFSKNVGVHSEEIPLGFLKRDWFEVESFQVRQISPNLPGGGIGNDRYYALLRFRHHDKHERKYFYLITHTNAAIQNRETGHVNEKDNLRARVTAHAMTEIEQVVHRCIHEEGRAGWVSGDFNYRRRGVRFSLKPGELWKHSPQETFKRLGMRWHEQGLDYLAWVGVTMVDIREIPSGGLVTSGHRNHSDHPWLVGTFRTVKRPPVRR